MKSVPYPGIYIANTYWTPERDVRVLIHLIENSTGDILEIGCAAGHTTRIIAEQFPTRQVFAVDWSSEQNKDTCKPQVICEHAAGMSNVHVINVESQSVTYPESIGFVFIDGDHSLEGVKKDSERAFLFGRSHDVVIAWHDYGGDIHRDVTTYLDRLSEQGVNLHWVKNSQIVFTRLVSERFL